MNLYHFLFGFQLEKRFGTTAINWVSTAIDDAIGVLASQRVACGTAGAPCATAELRCGNSCSGLCHCGSTLWHLSEALCHLPECLILLAEALFQIV